MTLTPELVVAFGSFIATLLASYSAMQASKRAAKKDEITSLQGQIDLLSQQLQETRARLETEIKAKRRLLQRVASLEAILIRHGIEVPPEDCADETEAPGTSSPAKKTNSFEA